MKTIKLDTSTFGNAYLIELDRRSTICKRFDFKYQLRFSRVSGWVMSSEKFWAIEKIAREVLGDSASINKSKLFYQGMFADDLDKIKQTGWTYCISQDFGKRYNSFYIRDRESLDKLLIICALKITNV